MDRIELLSFLAGEELRERELVKRWSTGGEECMHLVAHHTLRAERFGAVRRELSVPGLAARHVILRAHEPRFVMLDDPEPASMIGRAWSRVTRWLAR